jgi:predicted  nucleic acid-binding Zn-ribbon protein
MSVQIIVKCTNCGHEYNSTILHFCPNCSSTVDLRNPTEQIQDTSTPQIGKNHCQYVIL